MTITITHSAAEGTLLNGDTRPHHKVAKDAGFRWSGKNRFWYLPNSRDTMPRNALIERVAEGLRGVGFEVEVEIDTDTRPMAEREADRTERIEARQDGLAAKAEKLGAEATRRFDESHRISDMIPFGQPILVGHHSERGHRRDIARIQSNLGKGVEAHREAEATTSRVAGSVANQRHRESAPTTIRRIERLSAEMRVIERSLAGSACYTAGLTLKEDGDTYHCRYCGSDVAVVDRVIAHHYADMHRPTSGQRRERQLAQVADYTEQIAYWQAHLETLAAAGVKLWSKADFTKGDFVKYWGGWHEVVRVNAKSLTVKTEYTWTTTVKYDDVKGQRSPGQVQVSESVTEPNGAP